MRSSRIKCIVEEMVMAYVNIHMLQHWLRKRIYVYYSKTNLNKNASTVNWFSDNQNMEYIKMNV
jgi:hypothetical protein